MTLRRRSIMGDWGPQEIEDSFTRFIQGTSLATLTDGDAVYVNNTGLFGRAVAGASSTMSAIGVSHGGQLSGQVGRVVVSGLKSSLNYSYGSGFVGQRVYAPTTAGAPQSTTPVAGNITQEMGFALSQTSIMVAIGTQRASP